MPDVTGWLADPYAFDFMRRALLASLLVGAIAPLVGVWIVLRRLAYLGDAMSHATLSGVAVAYLAGWSITLGAIAAGLVMAVLMALLASHPGLREDSIIGTVSVGLFATAIILISSQDSIGVDLGHFLLGSITTVTAADLTLNAILGGLAALAILFVFGDLCAASSTRCTPSSIGIRVSAMRCAVYAALAVTIVLALQTVGLLMAVALLVIPAAACGRAPSPP
jgi:manganese/iron transport system permease protein